MFWVTFFFLQITQRIIQGCDGGGTMDNSFEYTKSDGGLCTEAAYPYAGDAVMSWNCEIAQKKRQCDFAQ